MFTILQATQILNNTYSVQFTEPVNVGSIGQPELGIMWYDPGHTSHSPIGTVTAQTAVDTLTFTLQAGSDSAEFLVIFQDLSNVSAVSGDPVQIAAPVYGLT
jgi:hypothetical protein